MIRTLRTPTGPVRLEEIDAILALQGDYDTSWGVRVPFDAHGFDIDTKEADVYAKQRWTLVRRAPGPLPPGAEAAGRVYRDDDRHLFVGAPRVAVGLAGRPARARAAPLFQGLGKPSRLGRLARVYLLDLAPEKDPFETAEHLIALPEVEWAEPMLLQAWSGRYTPTDPQYSAQWHLRNTGQSPPGGAAGADVNAEPAWEHTRGQGARIAVIDFGFEDQHDDLKDNVLDASAHVTASAVLVGPSNLASDNHGTMVAGVAAARASNGKGGCGIAPEAGLMLVSVPYPMSPDVFAVALLYSVCPSWFGFVPAGGFTPHAYHGAHAVSVSISPAPPYTSFLVWLVISYVTRRARGNKGVPIFYAVSNADELANLDPIASHRLVTAVGRTDYNDKRYPCAYGPELDFMAPGIEIVTTTDAVAYTYAGGTSLACPLAAGVAGLLFSMKPKLTRTRVLKHMAVTCKKVGSLPYVSGRNDEYGFGRVDAGKAVVRLSTMP